MSRIGKKPIAVPDAVKVSIDPAARLITVEGPKGRLSYVYRPEVTVTWAESEKRIACTIPADQKKNGQTRAYWGTVRSRIQGLITGVTDGYVKRLEVIGVGWNAAVEGGKLRLNIGFCHPVHMSLPTAVECAVAGAIITVSGPDKQAVGQFAAEVRSKRPPEPYNGKGIKYMDEVIIRKQGKVFGA